jgi:HTH-type transcriptional regulator/antitoxin HigA
MADLTYTVIKNEDQYYEYCEILEELVFGDEVEEREDEIELLTLLIRTWDDEHRLAKEMDPVELIKSLKQDHELSQNDLAEIAGVGKSYISEILNYKKRMSKNVIRNLASHFKIQQSALNQEYRLEGEGQEEAEEKPQTSRIFNIETGNLVSYDEPYDERKKM